MKAIKAFMLMLFVPKMSTYHVDPALFWIQILLAGFSLSLLLMGVFGLWFYYFSGELDDWRDDR
tara:strand:+ start:673 stop:864 length:192 start_codon:yes stop_codon:yes gene_type:complete